MQPRHGVCLAPGVPIACKTLQLIPGVHGSWYEWHSTLQMDRELTDILSAQFGITGGGEGITDTRVQLGELEFVFKYEGECLTKAAP